MSSDGLSAPVLGWVWSLSHSASRTSTRWLCAANRIFSGWPRFPHLLSLLLKCTGTGATDRASRLTGKSTSICFSSRAACGSSHLQIRQVDGSSLFGQSFCGICSLILSSVKEIGQPGGRTCQSGTQSPRMKRPAKKPDGGMAFFQRLPHDFPFPFVASPARVVCIFPLPRVR